MIDYLTRSLRRDREERYAADERELPPDLAFVGRGFPDAPPSETVTLRKDLTASGSKPLRLHKPASDPSGASSPFVPLRLLARCAPRLSASSCHASPAHSGLRRGAEQTDRWPAGGPGFARKVRRTRHRRSAE